MGREPAGGSPPPTGMTHPVDVSRETYPAALTGGPPSVNVVQGATKVPVLASGRWWAGGGQTRMA